MCQTHQERKRSIDQPFDAVERCPPTGNASSKMEPSESDLTSLNLPPWFAIKVEEMASPNPMPPGFVVKNGSNMRSRSAAEIPGPEFLDRHQHGRLTVETGLKAQPSCFRRQGAHCIDSVSDKVQEYLLEFHAIYLHLGKIALKLRSDGYFVEFEDRVFSNLNASCPTSSALVRALR